MKDFAVTIDFQNFHKIWKTGILVENVQTTYENSENVLAC